MPSPAKPRRARHPRARPLLIAVGALALGGCGGRPLGATAACNPCPPAPDLSATSNELPDMAAVDLKRPED
jgi:hypothetical protein